MIDLDHLADQLGVTIAEHTSGPKGWYSHRSQVISLRRGLCEPLRRCTLAHELAHAVHGDALTGVAHLDAAMERRADRWAAAALISEADYRAAEQHNPHPGALALELGVTLHMLQVWQELNRSNRHATHTFAEAGLAT